MKKERYENDLASKSDIYDKHYFDNCCGMPYSRENFLTFFSNIAQKIIEEINPKRVLDAGCGKGFLVEALRDRGIEAYGIDISRYAISEVREDIKKYCKIQSVTQPLTEKYDLIVCIEVLEHLTPSEGAESIKNFCNNTDDIIFSSTPDDFKEATHLNVKSPEYWAAIFAKYSFFHDLDFDASFITKHALKFTKKRESIPKIISTFERELWHQKKELFSLREELIKNRAYNEKDLHKEKMVEKLKLLFHNDPLSLLLYIYNVERLDLQKAFPDVRKGNYSDLIKWAHDATSGKFNDPHQILLKPYSDWFEEQIREEKETLDPIELNHNIKDIIELLNRNKRLLDESLSRNNSIANLNKEVEIKNNKIQNLLESIQEKETKNTDLQDHIRILRQQLSSKEGDIEGLRQQLSSKEGDIEGLRQDIEYLKEIANDKDGLIRELKTYSNEMGIELENTKSKLLEIQNSLGYNTILKCQRQLDKFFPSGTGRGKFKEIILSSLRTISKDGYCKYFEHVGVKIKRREFRILEDSKQRIVYSTPQFHNTVKEIQPARGFKKNPLLDRGINFAGYFQGEYGIAEHCRGYATGLKYAGIRHVLNNMKVVDLQRNNDNTFETFSEDRPYNINLISVNAIDTPQFLNEYGPAVFNGRYNIAIWAWELDKFPEEWKSYANYYDEIWCLSNFVAKSISKTIDKPVFKITPCISIDENAIKEDKNRFGIPQDSFAFLYVFDFHSVVERKNPLAVIRAFKRAFTKKDKVVLVLKYMNSSFYPSENEKKLLEECNDANIMLINKQLDKAELRSLMLSCDCYVSLHRSEGFGFTMAEAMYLGKPVIATPYGGNTDFMNTRNSFLVKYNIIELDRDYGVYKKGNVWADPDIDDTAYLMRFIYENPEIRSDIARRGSEFIKTKFNFKTTGNEILSRIQQLNS